MAATKSSSKSSGRSRATARRVGKLAGENTDILATLKREHDEVKGLLADLQKAERAGERRQLVEKIKAALVPHTKAEEKVVYDAIISSSEEEAEVDGHEGYLEHQCASDTLRRLEAAQPDSAEHRAAGKVLKELVEHHIREEEHNVWRDVREHFDDAQRQQMNAAFEAAKKRVTLS
jgi:hemerythrin superfamily protein